MTLPNLSAPIPPQHPHDGDDNQQVPSRCTLNIKEIAIKVQPWTVLGLLLLAITLLLLSAASPDSFRQKMPVVAVKIGAAELSVLLGEPAAGSKEEGVEEGRDMFYLNMWGWCTTEVCSKAKMLPKLGILGDMPEGSPLEPPNFPPVLVGMLLTHGISFMLAFGSIVPVALELWAWWQDHADAEGAAVPFHERPFKWVLASCSLLALLCSFITLIVDFTLVSRVRSASPPGVVHSGLAVYLSLAAYCAVLLHVLAWMGPSAYRSRMRYWRDRRAWYKLWSEGLHGMGALVSASEHEADKDKKKGLREAEKGKAVWVDKSMKDRIDRERAEAKERSEGRRGSNVEHKEARRARGTGRRDRWRNRVSRWYYGHGDDERERELERRDGSRSNHGGDRRRRSRGRYDEYSYGGRDRRDRRDRRDGRRRVYGRYDDHDGRRHRSSRKAYDHAGRRERDRRRRPGDDRRW